jgi:hypothetical protein
MPGGAGDPGSARLRRRSKTFMIVARMALLRINSRMRPIKGGQVATQRRRVMKTLLASST